MLRLDPTLALALRGSFMGGHDAVTRKILTSGPGTSEKGACSPPTHHSGAPTVDELQQHTGA